jgi:hypothetical protein
MAVLVPFTHGTARVAALGLGHSAAYALASIALAARLWRRTGRPVTSRALPRAAALSGGLGLVAWAVERAVAPTGRVAIAGVLAVLLAIAGALYVIGLRMTGLWRPRAAGAVAP